MKNYYILLLSAIFILLSASNSNSQIIQNGDAVVTCYSDGVSTGYVAGIINVQDAHNQTPNQHWAAPNYHGPAGNKWTKANLGEVFGIAIDKRGNIYLAAARLYNNSSPPGGPGGSGAIYRIDAITGMISTLTGTLNSACGSVVGTNTIPNTGVGLGNIAYDAKNDQIFATNFEDGQIYRIDAATGNILSTFDPFGADGCTNGVVPLDERIWGIGVYNDNVYFARWREDKGNQYASVSNEIWSIALNSSGDFTGTEQLEITMPPLNSGGTYSNPVADIAFSEGGEMLTAERTMSGSANDPLYPDAHQSRVRKFVFSGSSWNLSSAVYEVGALNSGTNSSGGVDFAYGSYDPDLNTPIDCDSTLWATGDALKFAANDFVYGMQRLDSDGDIVTNSVMIDFDGNLNGGDKLQIGDVEIFKQCKVADDPEPCKNITMEYKIASDDPDKKECCIDFTINNNMANHFTTIQATILTQNVSITGSIAPANWGTTNNGQMATWSPNSGMIPTGQSGTFRFCIFSSAPPPQEVEITYFAADGTECKDTIRVDCKSYEPPQPECMIIDSSKVECVETGPNGNVYNYSVMITNNSPFSQAPFNLPAANILAYSTTPGVNIQPNSMNFTPLGYGQTSGWLTFTVTGPGAVPGTNVCIELQLHGEQYQDDYEWCCPPQEICFRLRDCKDCCKDFNIRIESEVNQGNNSSVNLNGNITAGPSNIIKATATIVSAHRKTFGGKCQNTSWESIGGTINNPPSSFNTLPLIGYTQPFPNTPPPAFAEAAWGIKPNGVAMNGANLNLDLDFESVPFKCRDSLRFCVRYTFTDENCVTCDTLICYEIVRKGNIIVHPGGGVISPGPKLAKLKLKREIQIERERRGGFLIGDIGSTEHEDDWIVSTLHVIPQPGVNIKSFKSPQGTELEIRDRGVTYEGDLNLSEETEFEVVFDADEELKIIETTVTMTFVSKDNKEISFDETFTVIGRVVSDSDTGGDILAEDNSSEKPDDVRTYMLYLSNHNTTRSNSRSVEFEPVGEAEILAIGMESESRAVRMEFLKPNSSDKKLIEPSYDEGELASLTPDEELRPIYMTVKGVTNNEVTILYRTYDENGNIITESEVTLGEPLSTLVNGGSGNNGNTEMGLSGLYPNPAGASVTVNFFASKTMNDVSLTISDASGKAVAEVFVDQTIVKGNHVITYDTSNLVQGTYYFTISNGEVSQTNILNVVR